MLGVAYLFENKPDEARREFRKLLELRPDYRFDPLLDPQRVVDFFNAVVKEEESTIAKMVARRRQREKELADKRQREAGACACRRPSCVTNGIRSRSTSSRSARASSRTASAARAGCSSAPRRRWARCRWARSRPTSASTACAAAQLQRCPRPKASTCPPASRSITRRRTRRARLLGVQLVSGGLFFAVAIWGVIDAIITSSPRCSCRSRRQGRARWRRRPARISRFRPTASAPPGQF